MGERKVENGMQMTYKRIRTCDVCGNDAQDGITLSQAFSGWGNDSIDGCGTSLFCSVDCLIKADTLQSIGEDTCINGITDKDYQKNCDFEISNISGEDLYNLLNKDKEKD